MIYIPAVFFGLYLAGCGSFCLYYAICGLIELSRDSKKRDGTDEQL